MKLTVNKEQIIEGLQKAAAIIPAKAGAAYLRSIWLKAEEGSLAVMSTDANIEFTGRYPAEVGSHRRTGPGFCGFGTPVAHGRAQSHLGRGLGQSAAGTGTPGVQTAGERFRVVPEFFGISR